MRRDYEALLCDRRLDLNEMLWVGRRRLDAKTIPRSCVLVWNPDVHLWTYQLSNRIETGFSTVFDAG